MASSRKPKQSSILEQIECTLREQVAEHNRLTVALSGGVDSVVLLHALHTLSCSMNFELSAVHVEHGISPFASQWSNFCQARCDALGVPLQISRLQVKKTPQVSLEAAARHARYQIFKQIQTDFIVLAQHQDDQVETILLQLLRGAGVKGLGGMPVARKLDTSGTVKLLRPLLDITRATIMQYAQQYQLEWVTDESNEDITYNRNFLRHNIFPLIEARLPAYRHTLSRAGCHLAEASHLLDELADSDSKFTMKNGELRIERLRQLSLPRAKNLLRYLFSQQDAMQPSTVKLAEILRQLLRAGDDTRLHLIFGEVEIRCFKGLVKIQPARIPPKITTPLIWHGEQTWILESLGGAIEWRRQANGGIDPQKLIDQSVTARLRIGGERFQPDCQRPRRSLKKILQEASIPPWERDTLPLIYSGDRLVWVPGIGIDCFFQALPGEWSIMPIWLPN